MSLRAAQTGILLAATVMVGGCNVFGCPNVDAMVEATRKLDFEYLSQLQAYAASGQCKDVCRPPILARLSGIGNRPPVFEVLPGGMAQIKLSVCVDEGVILTFKEIGSPKTTIHVSWSLDDLKWDSVLLWPKPEADAKRH